MWSLDMIKYLNSRSEAESMKKKLVDINKTVKKTCVEEVEVIRSTQEKPTTVRSSRG
jgi:hypothetical protein